MSLTPSQPSRSNRSDARSQWKIRQMPFVFEGNSNLKLRHDCLSTHYGTCNGKFLAGCFCRKSKYRRLFLKSLLSLEEKPFFSIRFSQVTADFYNREPQLAFSLSVLCGLLLPFSISLAMSMVGAFGFGFSTSGYFYTYRPLPFSK